MVQAVTAMVAEFKDTTVGKHIRTIRFTSAHTYTTYTGTSRTIQLAALGGVPCTAVTKQLLHSYERSSVNSLVRPPL
jgi:hypothetical protein